MDLIPKVITITGMLIASSVTPVSPRTVKNPDAVYRIKPVASQSVETGREQKKITIIDTKTDNLKQRASKEITRRITSLTNIINKISAIKRLTQSQKDSLTSGIQTEIANLTALNTKIQADTDIVILREDVKSIVTSYRVYLLYIPQAQIIIAANGLLTTADTFTELAGKLSSRINEAKIKGEDVSSLEITLADLQAKIADAKTQANNAINTTSALQPTGYPENKPSLQSARTILQTALKDLQTAKQDAQKIVVELRKLNKNPKAEPGNASGSAVKIPASTSNTEPAE